MPKKYIPRLTMSRCSAGSAPMPLMCAKDHGVILYSSATPLLNANDHMPGENILIYGVCAITHGPCKPQTASLAWKNVNEKHIIEGAPALMENSTLTCKLGGVIQIIIPKAAVAEAPKKKQEFSPEVVEALAAASEPDGTFRGSD